jgi:hypothetical protein
MPPVAYNVTDGILFFTILMAVNIRNETGI